MLWNRLMPSTLEELNENEELRNGIKAVHFLTTKAGTECLITLVYERPLQEEWKISARSLVRRCEDASAKMIRISVLGRSKGVVLLEGCGGVTEELQVGGRQLLYWQVEGSFSNPNPFVNEKVRKKALRISLQSLTRGLATLHLLSHGPSSAGSVSNG